MSVYSMTGYGSASAALEQQALHGAATSQQPRAPAVRLSAECRAVNGRFLDLSLKLPDELKALEPGLRELATAELRRGKVELRLALQMQGDAALQPPVAALLQTLAVIDAQVRATLPAAAPLSVHEVLQWARSPTQGTPPALAEQIEQRGLALARECLHALKAARAREGARLVQILLDRLALLRELADRAEPLVPAVVQRQQQRFIERWNEALEAAGARSSVPQEAIAERALNEAASMAIRIDVAEELSRLRAHLDEIERLLRKGGEVGKRLDFLIQELHREANTLGSKSAALELTGISVDMKVAIEQMREQVQNLE